MKRLIVIVLSVCISAMAFASGTKESKAAPTVTVSWLQWFAAESAKPVIDKLISNYEQAHPGIKIELNTVPFGQMRQTIITNYSSGQTSDILGLNMPWTQDLLSLGALAPLDQYLASAKGFNVSDLAQAPIQKIDGHSWMVPLTAFPFLLFYNEDMLKAAGINSPPKTWAQLIADSKKLTDPSKNQYGIAFFFSSQPPSNGPIICLYPFIYTAGGRTVANGKPNLDSAPVVESLQLLDTLQKNGSVDPGVVSKTEVQMVGDFESGRVAFMIESMPHIGTFRQQKIGFKFGVAPVPIKSVQAYRVHGWELGLSSKSNHLQQSWDFVSYLLGTKVNSEFAQSVAQLPGNTAASGEWIQKDPLLKAAQDYMKEAQGVEELRMTPHATQTWQIFTNEIQKMMKGEESAQNTAQATEQKWQPLFSK